MLDPSPKFLVTQFMDLELPWNVEQDCFESFMFCRPNDDAANSKASYLALCNAIFKFTRKSEVKNFIGRNEVFQAAMAFDVEEFVAETTPNGKFLPS